jgi:S1-C subfamily serine protease
MVPRDRRTLLGLLLAVALLAALPWGAALAQQATPSPSPGAQTPGVTVTPGTPEATGTPVPEGAGPAVAEMDPAAVIQAVQMGINEVYRMAGPSVVNVTSTFFAVGAFGQRQAQGGTGTGWVFDDEGHIVTNFHVVADAEEVTVTFQDGSTAPAEVIGTDSSTDLAVLAVSAEDVDLPPAIPVGSSDEVIVGQLVVAIGSPFELQQTVTLGIISALERVIQAPDQRFIGGALQTDAALNPGNSGGPLLDMEGNVIGVNSQIASASGSSAGIGFAVSSATVMRVVPALIEDGTYPHPYLGVTVLPLNERNVAVLEEVTGDDLGVTSGVLVTTVAPGGPADDAGIAGGDEVIALGGMRIPVGGDIITAIDGEPMRSLSDLNVYLESETEVGDVVDITVVRDGEEQTIEVTIGERPAMTGG